MTRSEARKTRQAQSAQAEAARRNGALSHGPVTPEGKARSSQNALSHGLSAQHAVVHPEEHHIYQTFITTLHAELQPQGAFESLFFEQITRAAWNLRRVASLEAQLFAQLGHRDPLLIPLPDPLLEKKIDRLYRHKASNQRDFNRAHKELKSLQTNRLNRLRNPAIPETCPPLADLRSFTKRTQPPLPEADAEPVNPTLSAAPHGPHVNNSSTEDSLTL